MNNAENEEVIDLITFEPIPKRYQFVVHHDEKNSAIYDIRTLVRIRDQAMMHQKKICDPLTNVVYSNETLEAIMKKAADEGIYVVGPIQIEHASCLINKMSQLKNLSTWRSLNEMNEKIESYISSVEELMYEFDHSIHHKPSEMHLCSCVPNEKQLIELYDVAHQLQHDLTHQIQLESSPVQIPTGINILHEITHMPTATWIDIPTGIDISHEITHMPISLEMSSFTETVRQFLFLNHMCPNPIPEEMKSNSEETEEDDDDFEIPPLTEEYEDHSSSISIENDERKDNDS